MPTGTDQWCEVPCGDRSQTSLQISVASKFLFSPKPKVVREMVNNPEADYVRYTNYCTRILCSFYLRESQNMTLLITSLDEHNENSLPLNSSVAPHRYQSRPCQQMFMYFPTVHLLLIWVLALSSPWVTIKSRQIPQPLRSSPTLLRPTSVLLSYVPARRAPATGPGTGRTIAIFDGCTCSRSYMPSIRNLYTFIFYGFFFCTVKRECQWGLFLVQRLLYI